MFNFPLLLAHSNLPVHVVERSSIPSKCEWLDIFEIILKLQLRLSFCNLVLQGLLGTTARLIFIYSQYADIGPSGNTTIDNTNELFLFDIGIRSIFF